MNDGRLIRIEGFPLTAIAVRGDRPWGHAIDVTVVEADGSIRGRMTFCCHPEFRDFDTFQAMSTASLVEIVRQRFVAAVTECSATFDDGIVRLFRFNSPNDNWHREIAGLDG